ncbi:hypothetical protein K504DRAFT_468603 [Pleomassaria siparia CBS 279.74]|uniref:Uncharacterized protein n=1 Tax=Pleomassaria siparia CBS 279.74 TaxID=1314801 RepID=A0A6G1K6K3_9PLEO|nr:hypothetical protein K504DRAFT_468603 [Pleomassaria siparia CBS 279.74]
MRVGQKRAGSVKCEQQERAAASSFEGKNAKCRFGFTFGGYFWGYFGFTLGLPWVYFGAAASAVLQTMRRCER